MHSDTKTHPRPPLTQVKIGEKNPCAWSGNTADSVPSGGHWPHPVRFHNFRRLLATEFLKGMKTWVSAPVSHLGSRNAAASGSRDGTGLVVNGLEDARVPRGCRRIRGTPVPSPQPGLRCRGASLAPSLCSLPGVHRDQQVTTQLLSGARRGRVCRAQLAGAAGGCSPNARPPSGAASPEPAPSPGRARSRPRRPPARPPQRPPQRPANFVQPELWSPRPGSAARRRPPRPGPAARPYL